MSGAQFAVGIITAVALVALDARAARAQGGVVSMNMGSATDERGIRSDALTLAPTISFAPGAASTISLGASYTKYQRDVWQAGGAAALATRIDGGLGFALTLNGGGEASTSSYHATFASADATPAVEWSFGRFTVFGGGHAAWGQTSASQQGTGAVPGQTTLVSQSRAWIAPLYGALIRIGGSGMPTVVVSARQEVGRISNGPSVTERSASASLLTGPLTIGGSFGQRRSVADNTDYSGLGGSLHLGSRLSLEASAGSYPANLLLGTSAGRYTSAGISLHFGSSASAEFPHPVEPEGVAAPRPGWTRLAIRAGDAATVEIAGDWTAWEPQPAVKSPHGVWYFDAALGPGEYRYAFRVDGKDWRVPSGATTLDDGFGGRAAFIVVRGERAGAK